MSVAKAGTDVFKADDLQTRYVFIFLFRGRLDRFARHYERSR